LVECIHSGARYFAPSPRAHYIGSRESQSAGQAVNRMRACRAASAARLERRAVALPSEKRRAAPGLSRWVCRTKVSCAPRCRRL